MSRRIRKVRRARPQEYIPKTRGELMRLVKAAFVGTIEGYTTLDPGDRLFREEIGYLKKYDEERTQRAYSVTMDLRVMYSSKNENEWSRYGSGKLQDHLRAFARKHRNKFARPRLGESLLKEEM